MPDSTAATPAPAPAQPEEVKAVTQDEVVGKAKNYITQIPKIIFWGAVFFATFIPLGAVVGGVGAPLLAGALGAGAILKTAAAVVGVAAGGVGGFFGAQWAFKEKVGELALNLGLDAGEMTLRSLRRLLKQAKEKQGGAEKAPTTARLENAAASIHDAVSSIKDYFGDKAEPPKQEPAPQPAAVAKPAQPGFNNPLPAGELKS